MKITLLGHASIFVETADCRILMDPVFGETFCEGLNAACPQREIFPKKLPEFDFLVISHQHLDHFDVETLASLPKDIDVLVPPDPLITNTLKALGYARVYPLKEFDKVRCGNTTLMTTRSEVRVPEFGLVVADPSGVFWNTVDTYFATPTIQKVRESFPSIDFLLATWHISMETVYQSHRGVSFPYQLYGKLFKLFQLIQPKALAPGASGWKYINHAAWQNQTVFPVTRERFCHDVKQAFSALGDRVFAFNPGDVISFDQGDYEYAPASSNLARMVLDDRACLDFSPVTAGNPLIDPNPEEISLPELHSSIIEAIEVGLTAFVQEHQQKLFHLHHHWQVISQITVTFPDGERQWFIDFSQDSPQLGKGRHPLANLFSYITASGFYSVLQNQRGWDYLWCSGEYRTFQKIYQMSDRGILVPEADEVITDPLHLGLSSLVVPGANLSASIEKCKPAKPSDTDSRGQDVDSSPRTDDSLMCLGNLYLKRKPKAKISG
ncbi:MAG: MBL fold metallo-hydrolase [Leptolyngbya sp. SIO1E4]|nr:MBL fold metallo-hydrolase [Leptolyngbya sp. SIO1E4]